MCDLAGGEPKSYIHAGYGGHLVMYQKANIWADKPVLVLNDERMMRVLVGACEKRISHEWQLLARN